MYLFSKGWEIQDMIFFSLLRTAKIDVNSNYVGRVLPKSKSYVTAQSYKSHQKNQTQIRWLHTVLLILARLFPGDLG